MQRVGVDIVDVARIRHLADKWGERFLRRIFSVTEVNYAFRHRDPWPHLAARFAAKEALVKVIGRVFSFREVGIEHDRSDRPFFRFSGKAAERCGDQSFQVSLSHTRGLAVALVVGSIGDDE